MSASREKKNRQELIAQGYVSPRAKREAEEKAEQKKNRLLYGSVAIIFVVVAAVVLLYNSGIFQRKATALTVNDQKFTAAQVDYFYYTEMSDVSSSSYVSYMGLDTSTSPKDQTMNSMAKMLLGITDEGDVTWDQYLKDAAKENLVQTYLLSEQAKADGSVDVDEISNEVAETIDTISSYASSYGYTLSSYLKLLYGSNMTVSTFEEMVTMQELASHYQNHYLEGLTYTDDELESTYEADKNSYDLADYEYISFKATAADTTDDDGNTVEATGDEQAAARQAAEDAAADAAQRYAAGETLEDIAADYEEIGSYIHQESGSYGDTDLLNWVFDEARAEGDTTTISNDNYVYFALFHSRARQDYNLVNVRHILFQVDDSELDSESETYDADLAKLKEDVHATAEQTLQTWLNDGGTAELFAEMATQLSSDTGSTDNGGLYEGISKDTSFVQEFLDWCFEDGRQVGDSGVVDSSYGSHVMYLDSFGEPYWKSQVENQLMNNDYAAWLAEQTATESITEGDGMKYVGF